MTLCKKLLYKYIIIMKKTRRQINKSNKRIKSKKNKKNIRKTRKIRGGIPNLKPVSNILTHFYTRSKEQSDTDVKKTSETEVNEPSETDKEFKDLGFETVNYEKENYDKAVFIYQIHGMGCDYYLTNEEQVKLEIDALKKTMQINKNKKYDVEYDVEIICRDADVEKKTLGVIPSSIRNIARLKVGVSPFPGSYIKTLCDELREKLKLYRYIIIYGHSFGGAIANAIAKQINNDESIDKSRVFIKTSGSIYVVNDNESNNVNIENYMLVGDLSLHYNGLTKPVVNDAEHSDDLIKLSQTIYGKHTHESFARFIKKEGNVIWIDSEFLRTNIRTKKNIFNTLPQFFLPGLGSRREWFVHSNYHIMNHLQQTWRAVLELNLGHRPYLSRIAS